MKTLFCSFNEFNQALAAITPENGVLAVKPELFELIEHAHRLANVAFDTLSDHMESNELPSEEYVQLSNLLWRLADSSTTLSILRDHVRKEMQCA